MRDLAAEIRRLGEQSALLIEHGRRVAEAEAGLTVRPRRPSALG
jgi:hypothetical protein